MSRLHPRRWEVSCRQLTRGLSFLRRSRLHLKLSALSCLYLTYQNASCDINTATTSQFLVLSQILVARLTPSHPKAVLAELVCLQLVLSVSQILGFHLKHWLIFGISARDTLQMQGSEVIFE